MLQRFLCKCPLLEQIELVGAQKDIEFVEAGNRFTFVDLLQCVPLIKKLDISKYYMKYLCAGGMPRNLPTSPAHLKGLILDVCLTEQDEISSAIRIIMNSRVLQGISFMMHDNNKLPVRQTPANFLDLEDYPNLNLDHLEALQIENFRNLPLEVEFVKLIMAKSPVLKWVLIELDVNVSVDEELKILRDMLLLLSCPRPSPSTKLFVERSEQDYFIDSR